MADTYSTLQLSTPCRVSEATVWWEEVARVMGDSEAEISVIDHTDGRPRITVHLHEQT
jgi:hypothetical protein